MIYEKAKPCLELFIVRKGSVVDSLTTQFYSRKGIGSILSCANIIMQVLFYFIIQIIIRILWQFQQLVL